MHQNFCPKWTTNRFHTILLLVWYDFKGYSKCCSHQRTILRGVQGFQEINGSLYYTGESAPACELAHKAPRRSPRKKYNCDAYDWYDYYRSKTKAKRLSICNSHKVIFIIQKVITLKSNSLQNTINIPPRHHMANVSFHVVVCPMVLEIGSVLEGRTMPKDSVARIVSFMKTLQHINLRNIFSNYAWMLTH